MKGRPEKLFPLFAGLETLDGIGPKTAGLLSQIGLETPRDLLFSLPYSLVDRRRRKTIRGVDFPDVVTVEVTIGSHKAPRTRSGAYRIQVTDAESEFQLVYFHAKSDFLNRIAPVGARRLVSGRVEVFDGIAQMVHPHHLVPVEDANQIPEFEPVYHLTQGVSQKVMFKAANSALERLPELTEWIDTSQKKKAGWPDWADAIQCAHHPESLEALSPDAPIR